MTNLVIMDNINGKIYNCRLTHSEGRYRLNILRNQGFDELKPELDRLHTYT